MLVQSKSLILVLLFVQASAFAQKGDKSIRPAGANDVVTPVVMNTGNAEEINVGAFSFTPNEKTDPNALSKLRAELLQMEKEWNTKKAEFNQKYSDPETIAFIGQIADTIGQELSLYDLDQLKELAGKTVNKRLELLNQKRLAALEKQAHIYQTTQDPQTKIKAEIGVMELSFDIPFLRDIVLARKSGTKFPDNVLLAYTEAVKKLSPEAKKVYVEALTVKARKQLEKFSPAKYKLYVASLEKIDNFKALRQQEQERELQEQTRIKSNKEVFMSTTRRFAPETFAFFVASGAVTFNTMWIKSQGDPLAMERHIMSLKDPIAHISFYAFMQANGIFTNFHTSKASFQALDASTKRQMMVKLSYAGMAVGSLASSVVSDIGQSIVTCSKKWIQGKKDEASLESCNMAMKQWTVRKKTNQYFPQIISLFASQAVTELVENSAYRAFERMAIKSFAQKYLTRRALLSMAYNISSADVVLTCIPYAGEAKWVSKGLKFVGTVTKLSAFVAVDHLLSSYINRPISNILKPAFFDNKNVPNMNASWLAADSINWDDSKASSKSRPKTIDEKIMPHLQKNMIGMYNIKFGEDVDNLKETFPKDIENYTEEMQAWRSHLNESADADLAGWEEMTKKLLNQIDFSYQFYKKFTNELYTTLNTSSEVAKGELAPSAMSIISQYPLNRVLPFYGVKPGPLLKESAMKFNDKYLSDPIEAEKLQREHILNVAGAFAKQKLTFKDKHGENRIYNQILSQLNSNRIMTMMNGLVQLRKVYNQVTASNAPTYSSPTTMAPVSTYNSGPYYDSHFQDVIMAMFNQIGNPTPIMDPLASFSQASAAHTVFKGMDELADYSHWSVRKKYQFNKVTDLMIYKIVCGDQKGSLNQVKTAGVNWLTPEFNPPSLMKKDEDRSHFCKTMTNSSNLYYGKIDNETVSSYVRKNFNFGAMGDYTKAQNPDIFEKWWIANAKKPMEKEFQAYDTKYKKAYEKAYDNFIGDGTWYESVVDTLNTSNEYLPKSIRESLQTENSVYLQLINRALIEKSVKVRSTNPKKEFKVGTIIKGLTLGPIFSPVAATPIAGKNKDVKTDYLLQANNKIKSGSFDPIYNIQRVEVMRLHTLLNKSLMFIESYKKSVGNYELNRIDKSYVAVADNTRVAKKMDLSLLKFGKKEFPKELLESAQKRKDERAQKFNDYIENSKQIDKAINDILVSAGLKRLVKKADAKLTEEQMAEMAFSGMLATESGNESTEDVYEDLNVKDPTFRQKVIISAVKGIRQVEGETRRFIRMNTLLSNRLYVENQEILTQIGSN